MTRLLVAVIACVVLTVAGCTGTPPPTDTVGPTATPVRTPSPPDDPTEQPTPSSSAWVPCGSQILVGDTTGELLGCEDIGTVATTTVPHVANIPANPAQIRIWWTVETCATNWWLDIHHGAFGVTVMDLRDGEHPDCPAYTVGRALTLVFRPMISASDVVQLHNGVPVISMWPIATLPPTPATYPSTPSSIQFGRWDLAAGETLKPQTTDFDVMVYELACASGQSPKGRILEPFVAYDERTVWISFGIWSLPGVQSCAKGRGVPYVVHLSQPFGRRHLRDGNIVIDGWGGTFVTRCPIGSPQNYC